MRVFELEPGGSCDSYVEASNRWGLPGVACSACGATWANIGVSYPTVDLSGRPEAERYLDQRPVSWLDFQGLRAGLAGLVPEGLDLNPGTSLGALVGWARGPFDDLVWPSSWAILVRGDILEPLRKRWPTALRGAPAELDGLQSAPGLTELEIEPHGTLSPSCLSAVPPACRQCGRRGLRRPKQLSLDASSLASAPPIFRLRDLTTAVFVREDALAALVELRVSGFRHEAVPLE